MKTENYHQENKSLRGGKSHQGRGRPQQVDLSAGSRLLTLDNRLTYIFSHGDEMGSIHFDKGRGEIFFRGHSLRNMEVEDWHWQVMEELRQLLAQFPAQSEDKIRRFAEPYAQTLDKIFLEKKKQFDSP